MTTVNTQATPVIDFTKFANLSPFELKDKLIEESYILPFEEIIDESPNIGFTNQVLKTEKIPFISYPYEWSFSQLKAAAIKTLKINLIALNYGMILKDASMFNVQFIGYKPIFIEVNNLLKFNIKLTLKL